MKTICLATNNKHKVGELQQLLGKEFEVITLDQIGCFDEIEETGDSFEENSEIKAKYIFDRYRIDCIADDSGVEIDALNGRPGIFSARYAGLHGDHSANIKKVLDELGNSENRSARFRTVITTIIDGKLNQFEGIVNGKITHAPAGIGGFGYDPVFIPEGYQNTFAELSSDIKNKISHRGKAIERMLKTIKDSQE
jgi:XTP/dITP diphosphohydrolase